MIMVSFFFSHQALSIGISRDGIGLKVTEIAQTDTHSAFNVLGVGEKTYGEKCNYPTLHKKLTNKYSRGFDIFAFF